MDVDEENREKKEGKKANKRHQKKKDICKNLEEGKINGL